MTNAALSSLIAVGGALCPDGERAAFAIGA